mmetsp:Transcript_54518/g.126928  ORF Transcript_54518/g.126928 Transcript_54518/m.126928 type:complete len:223 (-) Transcript_54518:121-789(-)
MNWQWRNVLPSAWSLWGIQHAVPAASATEQFPTQDASLAALQPSCSLHQQSSDPDSAALCLHESPRRKQRGQPKQRCSQVIRLFRAFSAWPVHVAAPIYPHSLVDAEEVLHHLCTVLEYAPGCKEVVPALLRQCQVQRGMCCHGCTRDLGELQRITGAGQPDRTAIQLRGLVEMPLVPTLHGPVVKPCELDEPVSPTSSSSFNLRCTPQSLYIQLLRKAGRC